MINRIVKFLVALMVVVFASIGSAPTLVLADADAFKEIERDAKKDLKSDDKDTRLNAIDALAGTNDAGAVKLLQKALKDERDPEVITAIAVAFGLFTDPDAVEDIGKYLEKYLTGAGHIYLAYNTLAGFTVSATEETKAVVDMALHHEKSKWVSLAALEAMGDSMVVDYHDNIEKFIFENKQEEWDKTDQIIPITAVHAIARLADFDPNQQVKAIEALIKVLENFQDDRIRYHTATVMSRLVGLDEPTDRLDWWRHWLERTKEGLSVDMSDAAKRESKTSARPRFLEMDTVGKNIVFVLDVSKSMNEEVSKGAILKRKKQEERGKNKGGKRKPIAWNTIKNKLDLAIVDLVAAIESLDDRHYFNVVTYSTESELIEPKMDGFLQATENTKKKFINYVKRINTGAMTNIHGAMKDAFRLTEDGSIDGDPAAHEKAMLSGADTINFITDGWGSWSDDSKGKTQDPRLPSNPNPVIGDGKYILAGDILRDFRRVNKFRKVIVNTVGIGNHDSELMRGFAQISGGSYVDLGD